MTKDNNISLEVLEKLVRMTKNLSNRLERIEQERKRIIKTAVAMAREANEKRSRLAGIKKKLGKIS